MVGNLEFIKSFSATGVTSLSATNSFSDKYDVYKITSTDWNNPSANTDLNFRLIDSGGSVISDTEYDFARLNMRSYSGFTEVRDTAQNFMGYGTYIASGASYSAGQSMYIFNPYDSSSYTFLTIQNSFIFGASGLLGTKGIAVHKSAEQISGIQFFSRSGATVDININVYGVK